MSAQHFWNLSQLLGLFTCGKLANLSQNFVTEMCKQHPETTRRRLCCEKLGTSHDLKALPLVHFWSVLLLKEQMTASVRKTLKTLVWSAQIQSILVKFALKITTKSTVFLPIAFRLSLPLKFPRNSCKIGRFFRNFVPKILRNLTFFPWPIRSPDLCNFFGSYYGCCLMMHNYFFYVAFVVLLK